MPMAAPVARSERGGAMTAGSVVNWFPAAYAATGLAVMLGYAVACGLHLLGAQNPTAAAPWVLRYLLQIVDVLGKEDRAVSLAAVLLGYNSSANLSVEASIDVSCAAVSLARMAHAPSRTASAKEMTP